MLQWHVLDISFVPHRGLEIPFFTGSMIRGVLGVALKKVVCINPTQNCTHCFAASSCLYHRWYELPTTARHFRLSLTLAPSMLDFSLLLFEEDMRHLPYVLSAIVMAFESVGVGESHTRVTIDTITLNATPIYRNGTFDGVADIAPKRLAIDTVCRRAVVEFTMPLRIKEGNAYAFKSVQWHTLVRSIHDRYRQIRGLEEQKLGYQVHGEIVKSDWHFVQMRRYSNRQKSAMNMDGIKGKILIEGMDAQSWVYLNIGEVIGVGKQTVMGLGSYQIKGCE